MLVISELESKSLIELQKVFIQRVNFVICPIAKKENWCVYLNHCVMRIVLDNLFDGCWYNYLNRASKIPAYKQLSENQLIEVIKTIYNIETYGNGYLITLNNKSLKWRNKV